ncbi:MAG TPA: hypothetical protein VJH55_00380 [Candidatus Paceibacterota bacterium]
MKVEYLQLEGSLRAEVTAIFPGKIDTETKEISEPYALAVSEMIPSPSRSKGEITFTLSKKEGWVYKRPPKVGEVVYLSDCILIKKTSGYKWRSLKARPWRPMDEVRWSHSHRQELIRQMRARAWHLLEEAKIRLQKIFFAPIKIFALR